MQNDRPSNTSWSNPWAPMWMPMQQWMNAMQAWAQAWSSMVPGGMGMGMGMGQQPYNMPWPFPSQPQATPAVCVHVVAHRVAEVAATVNLCPGAECGALTVGPLNGEGRSHPLKGVTIGGSMGSVHLNVPVPSDQASGRYCGEVRSADGRLAGSVTVVISDLSGHRE
jgi:hypothetical protein